MMKKLEVKHENFKTTKDIHVGEDTNTTNIGNTLVGMYYYYIDNTIMKDKNNLDIFGYTPTIESISFNPFLFSGEQLTLTQCNFDMDYFKVPSSNVTPKVFRINHVSNKTLTLGTLNLEPLYDVGEDIDRLIFNVFPYNYFLLVDHFNSPLLIKPQLLRNKNKIEVMVQCGLSQTSKYNLYVHGYKDDVWGNLEGIVNNNPLLFPVYSTAYSQFLASSGASFQTTFNNNLLENDMSLKQGLRQLDYNNKSDNINNLMNTINGMSTLNMGKMLSSGASGVINNSLINANSAIQQRFLKESSALKEYQLNQSKLATTKDLLSTPRTMKSVGNDCIFTMEMAYKEIEILHYGLNFRKYDELYNYHKKYGCYYNREFKDNKLPITRELFNFYKFSDCHVNGAIPHIHCEEIKDILESGVTFWNVSNKAKIKNYDGINKEIKE
ncbi:MAG: hypothetical protein ACRCX2_33395 [Paraclostridium sp.]